MSLFDPTTDQSSSFSGDNNQVSFMERLVKEKGENWRDPEVLAKGKLESDAYIAQLKEKLTELETRASKEDYSKALLDKLQERQPAEPVRQPEVINREAQADTTLDADKIKGLIAETLESRTASERARSNVATVEAQLAEKYGTNAASIVAGKAKELGVGVDFLKGIAEKSPAAFFNLVNVEVKSEAGHMEQNKVSTASGFDSSTERNKTYYDNLRKEKPNEFFSAAVQNQMFADRKRLGDRWRPSR